LVGGRYRIDTRLGKGGAGSVYSALDTSSGKTIALKRLASTASKRLAALFELEYYTLSSLKHPNIVEVYDYAADADGRYYTMELLAGSDLSELAPLPWQEACKYASEAASALGVLHARRLVHRDLSPRNLRRTPEGAIKLLDFGALTAFGVPGDLVGTPPFVAPETLHLQALDQRVDLYAIGALLYQLITGVHAYPARSLRALPDAWSQPWTNPSKRVAALGRTELPPLPADLDALIESLLSHNAAARPRSAAEVIDRLSAVAGVTREQQGTGMPSALQRGAFIGRKRERRHYRRLLQQTLARRGGTFLIESKPGEGRSRLLEEFAVDARISGALALREEARVAGEGRGLVHNVALKLLDTLPEIARQAAQPHAAVLASLSPEVAARLQCTPNELSTVPGEARALQQEALCSWLVAICERTAVVLIVDDLDLADEPSQAWLASLSTLAHERALLIVASLLVDPKREPNAGLRMLRQAGKRVTLRAFSSEETFELLRTMFGGAENLGRLADRVHRVALGNAAHIIEQLEHFVRNEVIAHVDGTWLLPAEIPDAQLVRSRGEAIEARLARLPDEARALGRLFSLRRGLLPLELCVALGNVDHRVLFAALEALVREGVLVGAERGYRFVDEACRTLLMAELPEADKASAHARLGNFLLSSPELDAMEELEACVHLLQAGGSADAERRIASVAQRLALSEPDNTGPCIPALEQALAMYRAQGREDHELLPIWVVLAQAGYYVDRRYVGLYANQALKVLGNTLRFRLARRLRPFLGRHLSLYVALFVAGIGFARRRRNPCVPSMRATIVAFFSSVAALSGVYTVCVDPESAARLAQLLEPWTALGKHHTATFIYEFSMNLAATVRDRLSETALRWRRMIAALENPAEVTWLPEQLRSRYLGGALYAYGVLECWRDGPAALQIAERLERSGMKLYEMSADQLRTVYYANQANLQLFEHYRERAELHAIRRGSAWQVETWAPMASITPFLRLHDAMGMKQSLEQVQRLAKVIPSLTVGASRARGAYQMLRRRFKEALPWLEEVLAEQPLAVVGWARSMGVLARGYNGLGEHQKARDVCERALSLVAPEDLDFPAMNLGLQIEYALSLAGVGESERAIAELEQLLEKHAPGKGPLTLGALYDARARVAMLVGDEATCRRCFVEMESRYRPTGIPSLVARCETFGRELRRHFEGSSPPPPGDLSALESSGNTIEYGITQLEHALSDVAVPSRERYERALQILTDQVGLAAGGLWLFHEAQAQLVAQLGELPPELNDWVNERLIAVHADEVTQTDFAGEGPMGDPNLFPIGLSRYRCFELSIVSDGVEYVVGAIVFAERPGQRSFVSSDLLRAVAAKLRTPTTARVSFTSQF
jgi:tetratricopeptide (TPR) repeat protein